MRSRLLLLIPLLPVAMGACGRSLTPANMTGTGGTTTGAGAFTGGGGGFVTGAGGDNGGSTWAGGSGGSNAAICNTLMAEYRSAYSDAETCQVGSSGQCQQLAAPTLGGCGCTYVNDSTALSAIETAWQASGCGTRAVSCGSACPSPANYVCVSTDGGSRGVCNYNSGTGGVPGTGGFFETGGTTGTGSVTSSGGITGDVTGFGGVDGNGGIPGSGGGAANPCDTFASEYAAVLIGASSCTAGATGQCEQPVPASLSSCGAGCTIYVNEASVLKVIQRAWEAAHCGSMTADCPLVYCPFTAGGSCVPSDAGGSACSTKYGQITTG